MPPRPAPPLPPTEWEGHGRWNRAPEAGLPRASLGPWASLSSSSPLPLSECSLSLTPSLAPTLSQIPAPISVPLPQQARSSRVPAARTVCPFPGTALPWVGQTRRFHLPSFLRHFPVHLLLPGRPPQPPPPPRKTVPIHPPVGADSSRPIGRWVVVGARSGRSEPGWGLTQAPGEAQSRLSFVDLSRVQRPAQGGGAAAPQGTGRAQGRRVGSLPVPSCPRGQAAPGSRSGPGVLPLPRFWVSAANSTCWSVSF